MAGRFLEIVDESTNGSPATRDSSGLLGDNFEFAGQYVLVLGSWVLRSRFRVENM